jgi:hypothetical protein
MGRNGDAPTSIQNVFKALKKCGLLFATACAALYALLSHYNHFRRASQHAPQFALAGLIPSPRLASLHQSGRLILNNAHVGAVEEELGVLGQRLRPTWAQVAIRVLFGLVRQVAVVPCNPPPLKHAL